MTKILQDIWIMEENGVVIFNRVFDPKMDNQLFGALMSALNTFAVQISTQGLSNFNLNDKRFTIMKDDTLLFICSSSPKIKTKKVVQELQYIIDKFRSIYPPEFFVDWDNDIGLFTNFGKQIKSTLEEQVETFWEVF